MFEEMDPFVRALAIAASKADLENLRRIKAAFPEYWAEYRERALQRQQREQREQVR